MADLTVTPVANQIKLQPGMSLSEMANVARNAQAYQQAEQVNPLALKQQEEVTKQAGLKTESETLGLNELKFKKIADSQISMINNPLVIAAEQNPSAVDSQKLADMVYRNGMTTAKGLGIPLDQATKLLEPYVEMAKSNPSGLRSYYKERHILGLDQAARTQALQPSGIGVQHGAGGYTASTGEFSQYRPGQVIPGTEYVAQPTPTTELTAVAGDKTGLPPGTKYMIGPKRVQPMGEAGTVTGATEANQPTMVSGLNPAQAKGIENFGDYQKGLTARVGASNQFMTRSAELKELLTEFKPGAGSSTLQGVAQKMQALGAPQDLVDRIAGGDLSAAQSFNKFLAQSVIAGIRQAAGGDQTRVAEVENYIKNNPSIDTDPRALKRFIDFTEKQASRDILEQKLLNQAIKDNTFRPETWIGDLQQKFEDTGILPKTTFPTSTPSGKPSTQGRTVVKSGFYKGKPVVQYSDGSIEYK
jgi:hypothetical protein